jgi:NADH:ubiquinone oxidoreductase subunit K
MPVNCQRLQLFSYRRGFMIMAISAEIMLQKSGLAFKNFHQTIENLIMNNLDCMICILVR